MALPRPEPRSRDILRVAPSSRGYPSPVRPETRVRTSRGASSRERDRKAALLRRRRFAVIVVLPALLMIGSIYLHTSSAGVEGRVAALEERLAAAKAEQQELEVRVTELSQPGRVRDLARQIGMQDADAADIEVYGRDGEDGTENRGAQGADAAP